MPPRSSPIGRGIPRSPTRKREISAGTFRPGARTGAVSAAHYSESWGKARTNRTANDDRQRLRDYFVVHFGPQIRMHEIGEPEALRFVRWLADRVRAGEIASRTARSVRGVVRTMFRDAKLENVVAVDPFLGLPRKLLPKPPRHERQVYTREEVATLLNDERVSPSLRVLLAMMLYLGVRQGEACGRRWRDWDSKVQPLGSMNIETQYVDEPLKTDTARKTPVHPELEAILRDWWERGFELTCCRRPTPDDFIVPKAQGGAHTRSSAYKVMGRACALVGVRFEGCHLTRHTMITWARRGGARPDVLERVTHNAKGVIIDQYTHWDWEPLCDAVRCINYGLASTLPSELVPAAPLQVTPGRSASPSPAPVAQPPRHVAFHDAGAKTTKKYRRNRWRRRELNPSPRGIRLNLVHVRSRISPSGGVPEFGQDLAPENLSHRAGSIAVTQP